MLRDDNGFSGAIETVALSLSLFLIWKKNVLFAARFPFPPSSSQTDLLFLEPVQEFILLLIGLVSAFIFQSVILLNAWVY